MIEGDEDQHPTFFLILKGGAGRENQIVSMFSAGLTYRLSLTDKGYTPPSF